jgi:hypothetical protein
LGGILIFLLHRAHAKFHNPRPSSIFVVDGILIQIFENDEAQKREDEEKITLLIAASRLARLRALFSEHFSGFVNVGILF